MKLHNYILALLLVFLGVNAGQQKAHAEPPPILVTELARVLDGVELNYQSPYLWMRYSIIFAPNDPTKTKLRFCYKMDVSGKPYATFGWTSAFNYTVNNWTQVFETMTNPEAAWCWR